MAPKLQFQGQCFPPPYIKTLEENLSKMFPGYQAVFAHNHPGPLLCFTPVDQGK